MIMNTCFDGVVGKKCGSVIFGEGAGSTINLGVGDKKRRHLPLKNPKLSEEERLFEYEYQFIIYCSWRISAHGRIVGGWRDAIAEFDKFRSAIHMILNKKIESVDLERGGNDLVIYFQDGVSLNVFSDITNDYDGDANYTLYTPGKTITVGLNGAVEVE